LWDSGKVIEVNSKSHQCQIFSKVILRIMDNLTEADSSDLLVGVRSVSFLVSETTSSAMVLLNYDGAFVQNVRQLAESIYPKAQDFDLHFLRIVQRPFAKFEDLTLVTTVKLERSDGSSKSVDYVLVEGQFSNPNPYVAARSLEWLCDMISRYKSCPGGTLLELYAGMAHHTCALADYFDRVRTVEFQRGLVKCGVENINRNGLGNKVTAICDNCDKYCEKLTSSFDVVVVDPPRAGLCPGVRRYLSGDLRPPVLLYISCNPDAFAKDFTSSLGSYYTIVELAVMDHFPGTEHVEIGVVLKKNIELC
jgi:tRNA/tmRNA/rRNA uracil-C5-methylase (TrmA/RlmC/RlmD family)